MGLPTKRFIRVSRLAQPAVRQTRPARRAVLPMEIGEGMMCFLVVEMRGGMIEKAWASWQEAT